MDENHSLDLRETAISSPCHTTGLKPDSHVSESKKQKCLCAPTTHAGSFRCRLHRLPPPAPALTTKKGCCSQKLLAPKVKLAVHHKLKQGCSKRSSSPSTSRCQQDMPGLSRLSRTSVANEHSQPLQSDQEVLAVLWKPSSTTVTREGSLDPAKLDESIQVSTEVSSLSSKGPIRPLVKLPSI